LEVLPSCAFFYDEGFLAFHEATNIRNKK